MEKSEGKVSVKVERESPEPPGKHSRRLRTRVEKSEENVSVKVERESPEPQTCYEPGEPLPSPYCTSTAEPGHLPPFDLGGSQQPLVPPFVISYPMIDSQGIVYAHDAAAPSVAASSNAELIHKSLEELVQSVEKKLKGQDGLAVPLTCNNVKVEADVSVESASQSDGKEVSSDGSNGTENPGAQENHGESLPPSKKGNQEENNFIATPLTEAVKSSAPEGYAPAYRVCGSMGDPVTAAGKPSINGNPQKRASGVKTQDERQLKREKRKMANRESAVRSRMRKQAAVDEVMRQCESLKMENENLKSENSQLKEQLEKARLEKAALM